MHPCRKCQTPILPSWKICNNCDAVSLHDVDIEHMRDQTNHLQTQKKTLMNTNKILLRDNERWMEESLHYKYEMERYKGLFEALFTRLKTVDKSYIQSLDGII